MFYRDLAFEQPECLKRLTARIFVGLIVFQLAGCSSVATSTMQPKPLNSASTGLLEQYRIGVSDSLRVSVWHNPDLSTQVVVLPDGRISVPLVGDVMAEGETTESLADNITDALNAYIRQPVVTVSVLNAASSEYLQRVRITGAINNPLSMDFRRGLTVLDMVLLAGGLTLFANPNKALLYRKEDTELKAYPVRLGDILTKGKLETNYEVLPLDIITVPEKSF